MKSNKTKLREASKKAQRTRKSMRRSRQETTDKAESAAQRPGHEGHSVWPPYMKRALPRPDYSDG